MTEMTHQTAAEALSAAERPTAPAPPRHMHLAASNGSRPTGVNSGCTPRARRKDEKVPCGKGCGREISAANKSGMCRACWTADGGPYRNAISRRGKGDPRKIEPEERFAMLGRMIRSTARRAEEEDPGRGLRLLLAHEKLIQAAIREVGASLVGRDGQSVVAAELGTSKQNVDKRWGKKNGGQA